MAISILLSDSIGNYQKLIIPSLFLHAYTFNLMLCVAQCPPEVEFSELLFPFDVPVYRENKAKLFDYIVHLGGGGGGVMGG